MARLRKSAPPSSILVVCLGNLCRSPYAAAALGKHLEGAITVRSAGFLKDGVQPPFDAVAAAAQRQIDLSTHRSQLVTGSLVRDSNMILVMDRRQLEGLRRRFSVDAGRCWLLGDFDPDLSHRRSIPDPLNQNSDTFEKVYDRIDRCVGEIARVISGIGEP